MHLLKREQHLPISLQEAWQFFATPANLNKITPPGMDFKLINHLPAKMYEGLFIEYRIKPMLNIPLKWVTEITHIKEPFYFVDEQRTGPYKIWHHEHHFSETKDGVIMTDILHYDIGKFFFGWIAGKVFVHRTVYEIFEYRRKTLEELFSNRSMKASTSRLA
jgi:ligand-binding SRPBCC domain-containing protein